MKVLLILLAAANLLLFTLFFPIPLPEEPTEEALLTEEPAIHWHARLLIMINGQTIPVPAGVGLLPPQPLHTHDWDGVIHIETNNPKEDVTLGRFFDIWGVVFSEDCLFQFCHEDLRMRVNGNESREFDRYSLKDGDDILLEVRSI